MKTIISIIILIFTSTTLFSQNIFLKRKYTNGRFIERVKELHHEKGSYSKIDSVKTVHHKNIEYISVEECKDYLAEIPLQKKELNDLVNKDSVEILQTPICVEKTNTCKNIPKHNTIVISDENPLTASIRNKIVIYTKNCKHEEKTEFKKTERKSIIKLFFERENLKHLRIKGYTPEAIALSLINYYQTYISPKKGFNCAHTALHKNEISCSEFGKQAIEKHGVIKGFFLTRKRLQECSKSYEEVKKQKYGSCTSSFDNCEDDFKTLRAIFVGAFFFTLAMGLVAFALYAGTLSVYVWMSICGASMITFILYRTIKYFLKSEDERDIDEFRIDILLAILGGVILFFIPYLFILSYQASV